MSARLTVENIVAGQAIVAYSWGADTGGSGGSGFSRDVWRELPDGQLELTSPQVSLWLKLSEDSSTAQLKRTERNWTAYANLKRTAGEPGTAWPGFMPTLKPGKSNSPVATHLPDNTKIAPPAANLPATRAWWSGVWSGWACRDQADDIKLAIEEVTADRAEIIYSAASGKRKPFVIRVRGWFVRDELRADISSDARVAFRMRSDGNIDFLHTRTHSNGWCAGVLSKDMRETDARKSNARVLSSLPIVPPTSDLAPELAAFLGTWEGTWTGGMEARLVVWRITEHNAAIAYRDAQTGTVEEVVNVQTDSRKIAWGTRPKFTFQTVPS